ncbi:hypothetical protein BmR1_04g05205 [Babesia microti strain RI]|uniref:RRP12 HEAT domain-containing protein n=1 Tax=Babesia microti (strain RI) TaxID=1133968 RepID=I7I9L3_BABMR|nr:hypothetical protein BmR1_04g05205 [Babesia microti strain RI]CCF75239.1 hypothetical protein BmR1_04g05205 [Babesia microti strain RI]|eukprot:XP_012649647.1 hypothetical protein BmR1_04g05205 [Babesia microti strain RI]
MEESLPEVNTLTSLGQVEAHLRRLVNEISEADLEEANEYLLGQTTKSNKNQKSLASLLRQERRNNHQSCWFHTKSPALEGNEASKDQLEEVDKVNKLALDTYLLIKNSMSDMGTNFDLATLAWVSLKCLLKEVDNLMEVAAGDIFSKRKKKRGKKRKNVDLDSDDSANNYNSGIITSFPISTIQIEALCNLIAVTFDHMSPESLAHKLLLSLVNKLLNSINRVDHPFVTKILDTLKSLHRCKVNDDVSPLLFNLFKMLLTISSHNSDIALDATLCLKELVKGAISREDNKFVDLFYLALSKFFDRASEAIDNGDKMMPFKHFLINLKSFSLANPFFMPHYLRIILQISHLLLNNPPIFIIRECISTLITMVANLKQTDRPGDLQISYYVKSNIYPILLTITTSTLKLGGKGLKLTSEDISNIYHLMSLILEYLKLYSYKWAQYIIDEDKDTYIFDKAVTRIPINTDCKQALVLTYIDTCNILSRLIDGKTSQIDLSVHLSGISNSMPDELLDNHSCVSEYLKFAISLKNWVNISQSDMIYHNLTTSLLSLSNKLPANYFVSHKSEILDATIPLLVERYKKTPSAALEELFCDLARSYGLTQLLSITSNTQHTLDANEVTVHFMYPIFEKGLRGMPLMYYVENVIPIIYCLHEKLDPLQRTQENLLRPAELNRKKSISSALEQLYRLGPAFCRDPPDIITALQFDDQRFPKFLINSLRQDGANTEIIIITCRSIVNLSKSISNNMDSGGTNVNEIVQPFAPLLGQTVRLFVSKYKMDKNSRLPTQQHLKDCMKACAKFVSPLTLKSNLISFETEWTKLVLCDDTIKTRHRGGTDSKNIGNMNSLVGLALVEVARVHFTFVDSFVQIKLYESFTNLLKLGVSQGVKAVTDVIEFAKIKLTSAGGTGRLGPFAAIFFSPNNLELLVNNITSIPIHRFSKVHYKYLNSLSSLLYHCLNSSQTARVVQPVIQKYLENLLKIVISSVKESHSVSKRAILDAFNYLAKCTDAENTFTMLLERIKTAKTNNSITVCCSICMLHLVTMLTDKGSTLSSLGMNSQHKQDSLPQILVQVVKDLEPLLNTCTVSYVYIIKIFKNIIKSDVLSPFNVTNIVLPSVMKLLSNEELVSRHRVHVRRLLAKMAMRIDQSALWKEIPKFAAGLLSSAIKSISKSNIISASSAADSSDQESQLENDESVFTLHHLDVLLNGPNSIYNIKSVNFGGKVPKDFKDAKHMKSSKIAVKGVKVRVKKAEERKKGLKKVKIKKQLTKQPFKYIKLTPKMIHEKNKNETLKKLSLKR